MEVQHHLIIHLIDMVTGKDQNIIGIIVLDVFHVLVYRIRSTRIPLTSLNALIRREHAYAADIPVKIPGNTDPYV